MARYKLLAGGFEQADKSKPILGPDGKPTGRFEKRHFRAGATVESDVDLIAKFGAGQFELVGGDDSSRKIAALERELATLRAKKGTPGDVNADNLLHSPSVAPGGQVSTGWQANSGSMDPDDAERAGANVPEGAEASDDDLESMTVAELRGHAADRDIELHGATTKKDIIAAVKKGRK
jgi:uncharacterized small protein (DUF1192 family)